MDRDASTHLLEQVNDALAQNRPLRIRGGDSKARLGQAAVGQDLDTREHRGIVSYDPTELVVTVRAGTPLAELEQTLNAHGQWLACEPPHLGPGATVGGMVAAGLAGPRRPWAGSVRDFVLGVRLISGQGKHLRFGGEVMKNVAGYDLSRLMAGSFGCLGLITEVSLKVLPKPRAVANLRLALEPHQALRQLTEWGREPLPISAACHDGEHLYLRLEGGEGSVTAARQRLGGESGTQDFWDDLKELRLPFFDDARPLWRLSLPLTTPLLELPGAQLLDWGGAQRWLKSDAPADSIRTAASRLGGHATRFESGEDAFAPLPAPLLRYHHQLKAQLDPHRIFNPGRIYAAL